MSDPTSAGRAPNHQTAKTLGTVLLVLAAVGLTALAALDKRWFVAESADGSFSIGLTSAEMCTQDACRQTSLGSFSADGETPRLGLAVLLSAVFAGLLLFAATARMLGGVHAAAWLAKAALAGALFAAVLAGAWLLLSPWAESMAPGGAAIVFFIGTALLAATAAVPLGALRQTR